jgi:Flp pilus assembly protein TadD
MLVNAVVLAIALICNGCTGQARPKFVDVADLLCEGLEDFTELHNGILSVHQLIKQGDYAEALKVAYELVGSLDESKTVEGSNELRALVFLLESIVKGIK